MTAFTLATWNVNSINARMPRVLQFLEAHEPDIVCLQETKTRAGEFPAAALEAAGYQVADYSCGQWTGVALLVRNDTPVDDVICGLPGEPLPDEARWIEARAGQLRAASVYVVNGRDVNDPMFEHKLAMLEAIEQRCRALAAETLVIAGDFNIAPSNHDVWDMEAYSGTTHITSDERLRLQRILETGLVDAYRYADPEGQQFTWWDYRGGAFHRGYGLRIDLVLVSPSIAGRIRSCGIDRDFRKGEKPSDHAPVLLHAGATPQAM